MCAFLCTEQLEEVGLLTIRDNNLTKRSKAWTYGAGGSIGTLKTGSLSNINKTWKNVLLAVKHTPTSEICKCLATGSVYSETGTLRVDIHRYYVECSCVKSSSDSAYFLSSVIFVLWVLAYRIFDQANQYVHFAVVFLCLRYHCFYDYKVLLFLLYQQLHQFRRIHTLLHRSLLYLYCILTPPYHYFHYLALHLL